MRAADVTGYVASFLVFLTFYMKDMIPLRIVALFSNVAFLIYGGGLHLMPVVLLHGALIPVNICRLAAALRGEASLPALRPRSTPRVANFFVRDAAPMPGKLWDIESRPPDQPLH